jgi:hypothetical protein
MSCKEQPSKVEDNDAQPSLGQMFFRHDTDTTLSFCRYSSRTILPQVNEVVWSLTYDIRC